MMFRNLANLDGENNHAWSAVDARFKYLLESLSTPPEKHSEVDSLLSPAGKNC